MGQEWQGTYQKLPRKRPFFNTGKMSFCASDIKACVRSDARDAPEMIHTPAGSDHAFYSPWLLLSSEKEPHPQVHLLPLPVWDGGSLLLQRMAFAEPPPGSLLRPDLRPGARPGVGISRQSRSEPLPATEEPAIGSLSWAW